jgi:beta-xylosidase
MKYILAVLSGVFFSVLSFAQQQREWGDWQKWGDQGDGTYINPIIPSDYSDIDCIRVGNDYYAISSTFQFSPGMTVLHSKDLVNWEICGNAIGDLTEISDELNWTRMNRYGKGVWAGTLRYYNKRFYLFFGTPDEGYFMTSASRPEGPWEPLTHLLADKGWDDCTAMWDDNGKAYFVGTHFSDGYKTYLFNMSSNGKSIDRKSAVLINAGSGREANKLIKVNGWYYLIFSEHKEDTGRYVMAKRSRKVTGPYDEEKQLALPGREAQEPNQGGIVLAPDSTWHFLTHHGTGDWSGRVVSLLPVTWINDWPIIGKVLPQKIGTMTWTGRIPMEEKGKLSIKRSDNFDGDTLAPQWQWNYQPRNEKFSLSERQGWLRLKAYRPLQLNKLMYAGNTLTQRSFRKPANKIIVKMDVSNMKDGQKNGLCHFSSEHAAIGIVKEGDSSYLEYRQNDHITKGIQVTSQYIWLKSEWGLEGMSRFYYSFDGTDFIPFGDPYQLVWGNYRGDRLGIYCFNDLMEEGYVDVDYFHYQ